MRLDMSTLAKYGVEWCERFATAAQGQMAGALLAWLTARYLDR